MNKNNFNFISKNKHHYLRKGDVVKSITEGGLNAIDYEAMNRMIKLKWFNLPSKIFEKCGGINCSDFV